MKGRTVIQDVIRILAVCLLASLPGGVCAQGMAIPPQFDEVGNFHHGAAPARMGKLWGLINYLGGWIVPPRWEGIRRGGNARFAVRDAEGWGFITVDGQYESVTRFDDVVGFRDGLAAVRKGERWAVISFSYERPVYLFEAVTGWENGFVSAWDAAGWAIYKYEPDGRLVRHRDSLYSYGDDPSRFNSEQQSVTHAYSISDGSVIVGTPEGETLLEIVINARRVWWKPPYADDPVEEVIENFDVQYLLGNAHSIKRMSEGMAGAAMKPGEWGFFHRESRELLWLGRFEAVREFGQGFAPVRIGGKWGYIDKRGEIIIAPQYDDAYPFRDGYAVIRQGNLRGFLQASDTVGLRVFLQPQFEDVFRFTEGLAPVKLNGKWGFYWNGEPQRPLWPSQIVQIEPPD